MLPTPRSSLRESKQVLDLSKCKRAINILLSSRIPKERALFAIERLLDSQLLRELIAELAEDGLAELLALVKNQMTIRPGPPGKLSKIRSDHSQTSSRLNITEENSQFGEPSPDVTLQ
uniref:WGS project CBMI000000000 data, contig CS3069_c003700 n=1 Tax=Fusarium clavum TaxID=2594811 RepID=A0A090MDX9_9HYPO|nr:unnamed protein product [Fusarium clavum]